MIKLFLSYSRKDEEYLLEFIKHLSVLEKDGQVEIWYDGKIKPGDEWEDRIKEELRSCNFFIPLISADFFSSIECNKELKNAYERHKTNVIRILPMIIRHCSWRNSEIGKFHVLNDTKICPDNKNLADQFYADCVNEIKKLVDDKIDEMNRAKKEETIRLHNLRKQREVESKRSTQQQVKIEERKIRPRIETANSRKFKASYFIWLLVLVGSLLGSRWAWKEFGVDHSLVKPKEIIKIGAILPLSGNYDFIGIKAKEGIEKAVATINQSNYLNANLEIVFKDNMAVAELTQLRCNELLNENLNILIGPPFSWQTNICLNTIGKKQVLYITNAMNQGDDLVSTLSFNTCISNKQALSDLLSFAQKNFSMKNLLIIGPNKFGNTLERYQMLPKDVVVFSIDAGRNLDNLLSEHVHRRKEQNTVVLVTEGFSSRDFPGLISYIRSRNDAIPIVFESNISGKDNFLYNSNLTKNIYSYDFTNVSGNSYFDLYKDSSQTFQWVMQEYFEIVNLLAKAIKTKGSSPSAIAAQLHSYTDSTPFVGLSKNISFDSSGQIKGRSNFYKYDNGKKVKIE